MLGWEMLSVQEKYCIHSNNTVYNQTNLKLFGIIPTNEF